MPSKDDHEPVSAEHDPVEADSRTEAEKLAAAAFEAVLIPTDLAALDRIHSSTVDFYPSSDEELDFEGLEDVTNMFLTAFPDLDVDIEETVVHHADDSHAVVRYAVAGTHTGSFQKIPPTDREMTAQGICHVTIDDGQIEEFDLVFDNLGMLQDLGLIH